MTFFEISNFLYNKAIILSYDKKKNYFIIFYSHYLKKFYKTNYILNLYFNKLN